MGCSPDPDVPTREDKEWERLWNEAEKLPVGRLSFMDLQILLRMRRSDPPNVDLLDRIVKRMKSGLTG